MKLLCMIALGAAAATAQPVSFGAKVGVPLTDFFSTIQSKNFGFNSNTKDYIAGADLEIRLPLGLGIEFDALYHPLSYSGASNGSSESVTAHSFEFPLLAKYKFPGKIARPFVDAGVAFSTLSDLKTAVTTTTGISSGSGATKSPVGFVMGGGLDIHLLILHIDPEVRYTHWGSAAFVDPLSLVQGSQNQAEVLLGVVF
jgi:opacity protein-like surface antigen